MQRLAGRAVPGIPGPLTLLVLIFLLVSFSGGRAHPGADSPLVLEPLLPALARVGDEFEIGAMLVNHSPEKLRVRTDLDIEGTSLRISGKTDRTITIDAGASGRVRFAADAVAAGVATVRLRARAEGRDGAGRRQTAMDELRIPLTVEEPLLIVVDAHYGAVTDADSFAAVPIALAAAADPAHSALEIQLSTSLLGGIESALFYLLDYPYASLEQHASRLIGLAVARERYWRALLTGWDSEKIAAEMDRTLADIAALRHDDGGYRLRSSSDRSDPYLSAYTLLALIEARDAGAEVEPSGLVSLGRYLKRELDDKQQAGTDSTGARPGRPVGRLTSGDALAAALLAREGQTKHSPLRQLLSPADLERLYEHRDDLDDDGKLLLAAALNSAHRTDARVGGLLSEVMSQTSRAGGGAFLAGRPSHFGNDEQTTAIALCVLVAAWPDHELVPSFSRWLSDARRRGHWQGTHATARAVLALRDLARMKDEPEPGPMTGRVVLDGGLVLLERSLGGENSETVRITWPMARLTRLAPGVESELRIHRGPGTGAIPTDTQTERTLYHAVRVTAARPALALEAADAGLAVTREFFAFDPRTPLAPASPVTHALVGYWVRVELNVAVPRGVTDLVLVDPLPAGLEPLVIDPEALARQLGRPTGGMLPVLTGGMLPVLEVEQRDGRVVAYAPEVPAGSYRFEYLARAATPGRYGAPPAAAELIYDAKISGRSGAAHFEVRQRSD